MEIRPAVAADEAEVCTLWHLLITGYGLKAELTTLRESFRQATGNAKAIQVYVAESEGIIVGTASMHLNRFSTWQNKWYGHVEDVVVQPEARGKGIATRLIEHIILQAGKEGLCRLELHTRADNLAARRIYEKAGFANNAVNYELKLN